MNNIFYYIYIYFLSSLLLLCIFPFQSYLSLSLFCCYKFVHTFYVFFLLICPHFIFYFIFQVYAISITYFIFQLYNNFPFIFDCFCLCLDLTNLLMLFMSVVLCCLYFTFFLRVYHISNFVHIMEHSRYFVNVFPIFWSKQGCYFYFL